jgi:hypothetical protein
VVNSSMAVARRTSRRGPGKRMVDGKSFRLADEVRYVQRCAAKHDGRIITLAQLILFSTRTGDAWLLDPTDRLAARVARDGEPEPVHIEETDVAFAIDWKGHYRIEGAAFIFVDRNTRQTRTMLGYPTHQLEHVGQG